MPKIVDHQERRYAISSVTAGLIAQGGLEAATIRKIARECNFSKGVIEHYFESKDELIDGALTWANSRYEQRVNAAVQGLIGIEALRSRLEATIPHTKSMRDEWKVRLVFWSMAAINPLLRKRQEQRFQLSVDRFGSDLREAIANGTIDAEVDAEREARHLVNMITGISTAVLHNQALYTPEFIAQEIDLLVQRLSGAG